MKIIFLSIIALMLCMQNSFAEIKILDGDSIVLDGKEIRLQGIDAPEYMQICFDENNLSYDCGEKARETLIAIIGEKEVVCRKIGIDIYSRQLSECFADDENINVEMLKSGWAVLYRNEDDKYKNAQEKAKTDKRGIWSGRFMKPEFHRVLKRNKKD